LVRFSFLDSLPQLLIPRLQVDPKAFALWRVPRQSSSIDGHPLFKQVYPKSWIILSVRCPPVGMFFFVPEYTDAFLTWCFQTRQGVLQRPCAFPLWRQLAFEYSRTHCGRSRSSQIKFERIWIFYESAFSLYMIQLY
jgi:hypothetical protein